MDCPEIPLWYVLLATFGAVCAVSFIIAFGLNAWAWYTTPKRVTHGGQIKKGAMWWMRNKKSRG